jgi:hypothetical protein
MKRQVHFSRIERQFRYMTSIKSASYDILNKEQPVE